MSHNFFTCTYLIINDINEYAIAYTILILLFAFIAL